MKKITFLLVVALAIFSFTTPHIDNYTTDNKKSNVKWTGSKVIGDSHYGNSSFRN